MKKRTLLVAAMAVAVLTGFQTATAQIKPGKSMPKLDAVQLFNNEYGLELEDLRGYVVVVEFWATWCGPCKTSIPHMNEINRDFKDKGVVIIGISDEDAGTVNAFMKSTKMEYIVAAGSKAKEKFRVNGIPAAFIIDPEGTIRWQGHPMAGLDTELAKVVKEYAPVRRLGGGPEWNAKLMKQIDESIAKRDFEQARALSRNIDDKALEDEALKAHHDRIQASMSTYAQNELSLAKAEADAGHYDKAMASLRRLTVDFKSMKVGKDASKVLSKLQSDPAVASARRNSQTSKLADQAFKRAERAMKSGDKVRAYKRFAAIPAKYPYTDAAEKAKNVMKELATDDAVKAELLATDGG